jgi:hypothetical protein
MKCTNCGSAFAVRTDPESGSYKCDSGCSPNFERRVELREERLAAEAEAAAMEGDAMGALERRTEQSRREMEELEELERIRRGRTALDSVAKALGDEAGDGGGGGGDGEDDDDDDDPNVEVLSETEFAMLEAFLDRKRARDRAADGGRGDGGNSSDSDNARLDALHDAVRGSGIFGQGSSGGGPDPGAAAATPALGAIAVEAIPISKRKKVKKRRKVAADE